MRLPIYLLAFTCLSASAQTVIQTYEEARDTYFWDEVYKNGGQAIYCGQQFTNKTGLHVEHVVPASWIASHFGCRNRDSCPVDGYHFAAADLHNLWPSVANVNMDRSNLNFGEISGESNRIRTNECQDFERLGNRNGGLVEPRDTVKGDIARTIFYMELAYGRSDGLTTSIPGEFNALWAFDPYSSGEERSLETMLLEKSLRIGPLIAIADPSSDTKRLGAARELVLEWRTRVLELMAESQLIIAVLPELLGDQRWVLPITAV